MAAVAKPTPALPHSNKSDLFFAVDAIGRDGDCTAQNTKVLNTLDYPPDHQKREGKNVHNDHDQIFQYLQALSLSCSFLRILVRVI